jgi:hypothetical protein
VVQGHLKEREREGKREMGEREGGEIERGSEKKGMRERERERQREKKRTMPTPSLYNHFLELMLNLSSCLNLSSFVTNCYIFHSTLPKAYYLKAVWEIK